jgi:hypothetical protein
MVQVLFLLNGSLQVIRILLVMDILQWHLHHSFQFCINLRQCGQRTIHHSKCTIFQAKQDLNQKSKRRLHHKRPKNDATLDISQRVPVEASQKGDCGISEDLESLCGEDSLKNALDLSLEL